MGWLPQRAWLQQSPLPSEPSSMASAASNGDESGRVSEESSDVSTGGSTVPSHSDALTLDNTLDAGSAIASPQLVQYAVAPQTTLGGNP
jgi:hypothetical protein